uniref:Nucleotide-diphospho-sugar transferase domain-containing protein n=1 Tax=Aureoumbra lagunensis TaxID=44058 RepID=A0A7S3JYD5_9STRA
MAPTTQTAARKSRNSGSNYAVVGALCGLLGILAGFTFGHIHGMHNNLSCPVCTTRVDCPKTDPEIRRKVVQLAERVRDMEAIPVVSNKPVPEINEAPCEEIVEHATELQNQVDELHEKVKELQEDKPATIQEDNSLPGKTIWAHVTASEREELWRKTLGGFPYAPGASTSHDALIFKKKDQVCDELDVIVVSNKPGVCLGVFDSRLPIYTMLRFDTTGQGRLIEYERKRASPKKHVPAPPEAYAANKIKDRPLVLAQTDLAPRGPALKEALKATSIFGIEAPRLLKEVKELIARHKIAQKYHTVVSMATNLGTIDLVANFACSCRSVGLADALNSVLVFASDKQSADAIATMGLVSYHDKALGDLPSQAATTYGDFTFVRMMWLKVTAVYLVAANGFNVLFQDADNVWLKDPLVYFAHTADPMVDAFFMDDGARSMRYTPFYANSGFYFLRANDRVVFFMYRLLLSYDLILATRSHQHALIILLLEHVAKFGLTVSILDDQIFPQGKVFHHKKALMQQIVDGKIPSIVFHMCWTAGRTDKLKYMKNMGLWFLESQCTLEAWSKPSSSLTLNAATCCANVKPFKGPTAYTQEITIQSK